VPVTCYHFLAVKEFVNLVNSDFITFTAFLKSHLPEVTYTLMSKLIFLLLSVLFPSVKS